VKGIFVGRWFENYLPFLKLDFVFGRNELGLGEEGMEVFTIK
jgi:hypothetical protein